MLAIQADNVPISERGKPSAVRRDKQHSLRASAGKLGQHCVTHESLKGSIWFIFPSERFQHGYPIDLCQHCGKHKATTNMDTSTAAQAQPMQKRPLTVTPIRAFHDNYIWLLSTGGNRCAVVDPGDGEVVASHLKTHRLELDTILITHHHPDHIGGVAHLVSLWQPEVIGPEDQRISNRNTTVRESDTVHLNRLGLRFDVIDVPGHTRTHIAFFGHGCLFPGDTLFSAGCGRLFEGTAEQMQSSLDKLAALPAATRIYCAHEYTQSNCEFALAVEPENAALIEYSAWVNERRAADQPTLPSTIEKERACNPFLRTREALVVDCARELDPTVQAGATTMGVIRAWKDRF